MTRTNWTRAEIAALFDLPFTELVFRAAEVHRAHHAAGEVQLCTLLSIKTGGCPEDCGYCSQSAHATPASKAEKLMDVDAVLAAAREAKARVRSASAWARRGASPRTATCRRSRWSREVKALGLETCMTLGMLTADQARALADAGLDYYNHNIDTSPEYYGAIITTRTFQERLDTLEQVRAAASPSAAAGSSAWAKAATTASASSTRWRRCRAIPKACRSTRWCRSRAPCSATCWRRLSEDRRHRVRAHGRGRADHHAEIDGPPLGRPREHVEATQALCFLAGANRSSLATSC